MSIANIYNLFSYSFFYMSIANIYHLFLIHSFFYTYCRLFILIQKYPKLQSISSSSTKLQIKPSLSIINRNNIAIQGLYPLPPTPTPPLKEKKNPDPKPIYNSIRAPDEASTPHLQFSPNKYIFHLERPITRSKKTPLLRPVMVAHSEEWQPHCAIFPRHLSVNCKCK